MAEQAQLTDEDKSILQNYGASAQRGDLQNLHATKGVNYAYGNFVEGFAKKTKEFLDKYPTQGERQIGAESLKGDMQTFLNQLKNWSGKIREGDKQPSEEVEKAIESLHSKLNNAFLGTRDYKLLGGAVESFNEGFKNAELEYGENLTADLAPKASDTPTQPPAQPAANPATPAQTAPVAAAGDITFTKTERDAANNHLASIYYQPKNKDEEKAYNKAMDSFNLKDPVLTKQVKDFFKSKPSEGPKSQVESAILNALDDTKLTVDEIKTIKATLGQVQEGDQQTPNPSAKQNSAEMRR